MKSNIWTVMKKELARFFGDKRMVFTTVLLPGLMIYIMYSFMGSAIGGMFTGEENDKPTVSVVNLSATGKTLLEQAGFELHEIGAVEMEDTKAAINEKERDLLMVFPQDFDRLVAEYDPSAGTAAPNIEIYFNSTNTESQGAFQAAQAVLDSYESTLSNKFDINRGEETYDLATQKDATGMIFASMLPMLLMIFLFTGCMAVAPESIAGEKERGTIATLLITPIKRSELAIGKITALAIIALLSGISSAAGTLLSLPKLMGAASGQLDATVYHVLDYVLLGVVILSTVLLLITMISILSAFAKTVKEAQTLVTPLMIIVMLIGVTAMFGDGAKTAPYFYLIPVYNSVQCMSGIFSFSMVPLNAALCIVSNLVYALLGVVVLAKMFNSEKVVFSR